MTALGLVAIENIAVGDIVIATDPETGETAEKEVLHTFVNETDELVHLTVNGEEIVSTPGHKFYAPEKGWTSAIDLCEGDILVLVNGEYVVVEQVQHEILETPVKVYNFEVEDFHTYYVGEQSVLVHNKRCHNNSLDTDAPAQGYALRDRDTHEILKYGETTQGNRRYTQRYLDENNAYIDWMASGTKREMHEWQHEMILNYASVADSRPPLNKSFW